MSAKKPRPWEVAFLPVDPHKPDIHQYQHWIQARKFCEGKLADLSDWCKRFNGEGLIVIDNVRQEVAETQGFFWQNPHLHERIISAVFDEHSGMKVTIRVRFNP